MNIAKLAGGFTGTIGKIDKLARAAHGLVCLASTLSAFLNPANLLAGLAAIAVGAASMVADMVGGLIKARVNQLLGTALLPLMMLQGYIARLQALTLQLGQLFVGIENRAENLLNYIFNTQDCASQAAQLMNCITKLIAKKITNKILPKIDSVFGKLQAEVSQEVFKTGGILEQQVGRRIRTAEKITAQLSILR